MEEEIKQDPMATSNDDSQADTTPVENTEEVTGAAADTNVDAGAEEVAEDAEPKEVVAEDATEASEQPAA